MSIKHDVLQRIVRVRMVGPRYRIEIDTNGTPYEITRAGLKELNRVLDAAPEDYAIDGARRERLPASAAPTTYGGRLEIPCDENASSIAQVISTDVRTVLAGPGSLSISSSSTAAA
jgi:hypothetical protein